MGSPSWIETKAQLDDYFFQFPEDLLQFSKLEHAYQFEAMIWMHGFFIVLYSTRDIVNLLKDPSYLQVERLCHILEHSLLLSEVLQPLLSIDTNVETLSPTTIYFICLSSVVQSLALRQFTSQSTFERLTPPPALLVAAQTHMEILKGLQNSSRQTSPLLRESENLLTICLEIATGDMNDGFSFSCEKLYLHRWTHKGTGMTNMKEEEANQEWNYAELPTSTLWNGATGQETELAVAILQLCSPAQRLCSAGFFDLSIMIPM
ncbi:hypothetical protein N7493_004774 [Penicillium malachiteum]|uniref:Transcription factor domain-containing protein n=1 Tax=Penicillium malachiteum TaxID=1324776 RepID=A0AAD6MXC4_9EURO|nr:hypothetical protein N7493_004774 [Penicillium malachiteum]